MPALAERTKIRSEKGFETSTTKGWAIIGHVPDIYWPTNLDEAINPHFYGADVSSIRIQSVPFLTRPSEQAQTILQKIVKYQNLVKGWDGEDAVPPSKETVIQAYNFASSADEFDLPFYFTAPGPNGEIVIEFKSGDKTAEVYLNEDDTSEMMLYNGKKQVYSDKVNMELLTQHFR